MRVLIAAVVRNVLPDESVVFRTFIVEERDRAMQLTTAPRDGDDYVIVTEERLHRAVIVCIRLRVAIHFEIQRLQKPDAANLRTGEARRKGEYRKVLTVRNGKPLAHLRVLDDIVLDVLAAEHERRDDSRILLNHHGGVPDVGVNRRGRIVPCHAWRDLLRPSIEFQYVEDVCLAVVRIALDLALPRREDVRRHLVLSVDDHVLQLHKVPRLNLRGALRWGHGAVYRLTERAMYNIIRRERPAWTDHRRRVGVDPRRITLHVDALRSAHDERCKTAPALAVLGHDGRCRRRRRYDRIKRIEQKTRRRLDALHCCHQRNCVIVVNHWHVQFLLTSAT